MASRSGKPDENVEFGLIFRPGRSTKTVMHCPACEGPTTEISLVGPDCRFALRRCEGCDRGQWYIDGQPAPLAAVLDGLREWAGTTRSDDVHRMGGVRRRGAA